MENKELEAELQKKDSELRTLIAELNRLRAELESRDAEMDEERRAMMFMLEDTNRSTEEMEKANARLREEMEVTSHLLMISEATARTTDVDRLMEQVVHCGNKILKCDICLSYLWDREARVFRPCKANGLSHEKVPLFMTETLDEGVGIVRRVLGGKEPLMVLPSPSHVNEWAGTAFSWVSDVGAIVAIPLSGITGLLGLIAGVFSREIEVKKRDEAVMRGISHQVSVALEQARLYKESIDRAMELSGKIETIKAMHEIDRAILSTLNRDEILGTAVMMISRVIPCDKASVTLVDKERGGFVTVAGFGIEFLPKGSFVPFTDTTAAEMIKTGRTQYVSNIEEMEEPLPQERRLLDNGFLSIIRVPLMVKGEVIGGLSIGSKRRSIFTPENLSTIEKMAAQIGVALENARLISDLEELFIGTVKSLSSAIDAKSPWTAGHSERVTEYALQIGKEMGLSEKELKDLELAGLLHDVGKIGTYDVILDKPDRLSDEEQDLIKQHPVKGAEILAPIRQLKEIIPAIRHHQEFYDGTGYPDGLTGEAIPLFARIIGVADTVDAMGADRPYRKGRPKDAIIAELKRCAGTQFDPKVVDAFLSLTEKG